MSLKEEEEATPLIEVENFPEQVRYLLPLEAFRKRIFPTISGTTRHYMPSVSTGSFHE